MQHAYLAGWRVPSCLELAADGAEVEVLPLTRNQSVAVHLVRERMKSHIISATAHREPKGAASDSS